MKITFTVDPTTLPVAGTISPTQGQGTAFPSGLTVNGCGTLYFMNKSNVGVNVLFEDGGVTVIPAWWARPYTPKTRTGQLWLSQAYILNSSGNPISMLYLETYQQSEDASGLYSGPINYETNVGNSVPLNANASSVTNDGNAPGTQFIEAKPSGASSSDVSVTNSGNAFLAGFLQAQSNVILDQSLGASNLIPDRPAGTPRGFGIFGWDGANSNRALLIGTDGSVLFQFGNHSIKAFSIFSGVGTGTFNHGLGTTPAIVIPIQHAVGSQTMGYDSENATTVHITAGNGAAWVALAIA